MQKSKFTHTIVSQRFTRLFASVVIGIGLLVLIGWFSGLMFLTRFSDNEVPMAPSTAYVFIFMAAGLWFYLRPQKIAINRNAAIASAVLAICLSCLLVITNILKYYANWEHAFIRISETQLSMQLGHMSLVTAILFIISGFALLFLLSNRKIVKTFSIILTLIIFIISFILLLGYAFGAPFFYFDNFIPPAVLTVLSFLVVSLALIAASDKNTFFVKTIWKTSTSAKLLRIFLPTTIAITVIESLIVIRILPLFNIHPAIGVSLVNLIFVVVVISIISKSIGKALDSTLENLSESEERFRTISENAPVLINSFDEDGRCLFWNNQCNKTFGWTIQEINAHEVAMELFYPDPAVREEVIRTVTSDPDGSFREWHPVTKDGKILSVMWANFSLPNGQVFHMGHDITERKQAEAEIIESNEKYLNLIDSLGTGGVLHGPDTSIVLSNPKASEILGISPEQMQGKRAIDPQWRFVRSDGTDMPPEEYPVNKALRLMKSFSDYFIGIKRPDREYITWVNVNASLVFDENKNIKYVTISFNDKTEQKKSEQALKESEAQLRLITDNLPVLISQIDKDLKYTFANKYYSDISLNQDEIIGKNVVDIIGEETFNNAYPHMQKALSGEFVSFENSHRNKNNKLLIIETQYIPYVVNDQVESFFVLAMDITERKLAENKVIEALERLSAAEEIAKMGSWSWNPNTNKVEWSDNMCRLYGIEPSEFDPTLDSAIRCTHPDDLDYINKLTKDLLTKKIPQSPAKYRIITPKNKIVWIESTAHILSDKKGNIKEYVGAIQDITERKQVEEEIKKNQILLQHAEEISNQGAWEWDIVQDEWTFSENWLHVHGCRLSGITHEELMTIAYPEDAPKVEKAFKDALNGGAPYNIEYRIVRQNDGEVRNVRAKGNLILNDSGQPVKMYGVAQDITNDKLAQEALRESEAKLNALFTSMTEIVVIHELVLNSAGKAIDYRFIDCNNAYTEATGVSKEDAIGKLASEVYHTTPPPYLEKYAMVALGGDPHEFTTYYSPVEKHYMISVVSLKAGKFATITTDISDMMQIQEMIVAKNKEMENYLYVASHDLRTPLVNIQGFSQRLKKQADSIKNLFSDKTLEPEILHQLGIITDEDIPKTLSFVLGNIEKMDTLINGLLKLSRTGRVDMSIQKIDMNALFAKILQSLDFQIKEAQCEIHIHPLPECYGDAPLLDQLFENIISNALKYSDSERALEITVDAKKTYNKVVYTIRDTGKGIAQKYLDKIWDVFYRIDPRSGTTGEGIGLSLVKRIAEKHKGKVWAESEENKGSVFYIELHNRIFSEI